MAIFATKWVEVAEAKVYTMTITGSGDWAVSGTTRTGVAAAVTTADGTTYSNPATVEVKGGEKVTFTVTNGGTPVQSTITVDGTVVATNSDSYGSASYEHTVDSDLSVALEAIYDIGYIGYSGKVTVTGGAA